MAAVFDFTENVGDEKGPEDGERGLANQDRQTSTRTRPTIGMTKSSIGRRNVIAAANGNAKEPSQSMHGFNVTGASRLPSGRLSRQLVGGGELGSQSFFGRHPLHDGPRQVGVPKARTNGKGVDGRQANKLRNQDDDEIADVTPPERRTESMAGLRGAAGRGDRQTNRQSRRGGDRDTVPDSDVESEHDTFGQPYAKPAKHMRPEKKAQVLELAGEGKTAESGRRGWKTKRKRASEGGDEAHDMPPEKRSRAGHQNGRKQGDETDHEYKPSGSRCAVKRAPQNSRKAKGEAEVINLDSEETPHKDTPGEAGHHDVAPRKLDLDPPAQAGPSFHQQDQDKTYLTGHCWLGTFAAEGCTVFFDASRLRVTVPPQFVRGGAASMTFEWDLGDLAAGKSLLLEAKAQETIMIAFHFEGPVHPSLAPYLNVKSKDLHARTVVFEVDHDEWKQTQTFGAWPTDVKEQHFDLIGPQDLARLTDGRPTQNKALLDPQAEAQPVASGHYTRSTRHVKPSIKTFHFPLNDPDAVTISTSDLARLEPHEFLNDTLIDFYIKFLQEANFSAEHKERIHIVNSFFFKKLTETAQEARKRGVKREEAFRRMNKWTRKVNIFDKSYLIVPVNQSLHWSLAIAVYPGGGDSVDGKVESGREMRTPCILQLDSMAGGHANVEELLRTYLTELWLSTHPEEKRPRLSEPLPRFSRAEMPFIQVKVPQQDNHCDCGLFLLHYVEQFIADPPPIFDRRQRTARKGLYRMTANWFQPAEASAKRYYLRDLIIRLAEELGRNNASILEPDALKALWMDVVDSGAQVQTRKSVRLRQGSGESNRLPTEGAAGRAKEDRADVGLHDSKAPTQEKAAASEERDAKQRPVMTSAYDEVNEGEGPGEATGQRHRNRGRLPDHELEAALNEEVPEGLEPHMSFILDASPEKRKAGAAVDKARDQKKGVTDVPLSEEPGDPLGCYRHYSQLATPKIGRTEPAMGKVPARPARAPTGVGKDPAGTADVTSKLEEDNVPDSEEEEDDHGAPKRGRYEPEASRAATTSGRVDAPGATGVSPNRRKRAMAEPRRKRARSESLDCEGEFQSAEGSPAREQVTEHGVGEGSGRSSRKGSPVVRSARLLLEPDGSEEAGSDGGRSFRNGSDGQDPDDVLQRSSSGGFPEMDNLQEGLPAENVWAADGRPAASRGGSETRDSRGEAREHDKEKQLMVHPAVGVYPETAELGGEAFSDGEAQWGDRQQATWHEDGAQGRVADGSCGLERTASGLEPVEAVERLEGVGRGREHETERGARDEKGLRAGFGAAQEGSEPAPGCDEPSAGSSQEASESPRLYENERRGRQRAPLGAAATVLGKEELSRRVNRAVSGKEGGESSAPDESQSAFSAELAILGGSYPVLKGSASTWNGIWGSGSPLGEVEGRRPSEEGPRGRPRFVEEEAGCRDASTDVGVGVDVRKSAIERGNGSTGIFHFSRDNEKNPGREYIDVDKNPSAEQGGATLTAPGKTETRRSGATRTGKGGGNRSLEEIKQRMVRPKGAEDVKGPASKEDGVGGLPSKTILTPAEMHRLNAVWDQLNDGAESGEWTRQGEEGEPKAVEEKPRKIDGLVQRARQKLLEPESAFRGFVTTEARDALEEPARLTGRLAGEANGDRLVGGSGSRLDEDKGSAGRFAAESDAGGADRDPISQDFSQEDEERGGQGSPRGGSDAEEGRRKDGSNVEGSESTAPLKSETSPEEEDVEGFSAGDRTEALSDHKRKRQKTPQEDQAETGLHELDVLEGAGGVRSQKPLGGNAVQPKEDLKNKTPASGVRKRGAEKKSDCATLTPSYLSLFGSPGLVGTRVSAGQQGFSSQKRSPKDDRDAGTPVERKAADGAKLCTKRSASGEKGNLLQSGFVIRKGELSARTIQPVVGDGCKDGAQGDAANPKQSKSFMDLMHVEGDPNGGGLREPESREDGRGRPTTGLRGTSPVDASENVKEGPSKTSTVKRKAEVVSLDSDDEDDAGRREDKRHTGRPMRSTRMEIKSQERKRSFEEAYSRRKLSRVSS